MTASKVRHGQSVYTTEKWKQLSKQLRHERRACEMCGAVGRRTVLDHRVELRDGGAPFDLANLSVLCWPCHSTKTHATARARQGPAGGGIGRSGVDSSLAATGQRKETQPAKKPSARETLAAQLIQQLRGNSNGK